MTLYLLKSPPLYILHLFQIRVQFSYFPESFQPPYHTIVKWGCSLVSGSFLYLGLSCIISYKDSPRRAQVFGGCSPSDFFSLMWLYFGHAGSFLAWEEGMATFLAVLILGNAIYFSIWECSGDPV